MKDHRNASHLFFPLTDPQGIAVYIESGIMKGTKEKRINAANEMWLLNHMFQGSTLSEE
jgi:hypothetical protein